jgi:hypothetical protein
MKRKVRIQVTRIRNQAAAAFVYCRACGFETEILTPSDAEQLLQVSSSALMQLILTGSIHAISTVTGSVCICKRSIFAGDQFT